MTEGIKCFCINTGTESLFWGVLTFFYLFHFKNNIFLEIEDNIVGIYT